MLLANTLQDIEKLPPEAQTQLVNFIEFLMDDIFSSL